MAWLRDVEPALVSVPPAGLDVTVYPVIAVPPLETGAVKVTVAEALPAVATTEVGAPGTVVGVMELDGEDAADVPTPLVAVAVKL
jgi:hypothetical protein